MPGIPVYLLTGYLGAGKTTVLNHLPKQDELRNRRVALIINEFGKLAGTNNSIIVPSNLTDVAGTIASAMTVIKNQSGGKQEQPVG